VHSLAPAFPHTVPPHDVRGERSYSSVVGPLNLSVAKESGAFFVAGPLIPAKREKRRNFAHAIVQIFLQA
jgi:hypothetical protein